MKAWKPVDELINELKTISDIELGGPASPETIMQVERKLGGKLPVEVVTFLGKYGQVFLNDESISGIYDNDAEEESNGTIVGDTEECRKFFGLPIGFAVVEYHSGDYCLCVSLTEEAQVSSPVLDYNVFQRKFEEHPLYDSFLKYLISYLTQAVEINID
ncbi:hypothetical protein BTA51_24175 [Hahella sp. CCB-MM4]|uniref:SMI1/KNR4 family protein n=1 Tax=Hahella sp. (strain CCB-MM4) TaxID=1926491 RepID=UPI000B9B2C56|nr:SMI1/KNR4 family protein [Hahella sp. CCB-MM4]OZG70696.1 hypothetical protein BTA51_24175 [Hahella sp. CCB-MM4]